MEEDLDALAAWEEGLDELGSSSESSPLLILISEFSLGASLSTEWNVSSHF